MKQTVIQYVLSRLNDLGVTEAFGIPGDYVYDVCGGIEDDPDINNLKVFKYMQRVNNVI